MYISLNYTVTETYQTHNDRRFLNSLNNLTFELNDTIYLTLFQNKHKIKLVKCHPLINLKLQNVNDINQAVEMNLPYDILIVLVSFGFFLNYNGLKQNAVCRNLSYF